MDVVRDKIFQLLDRNDIECYKDAQQLIEIHKSNHIVDVVINKVCSESYLSDLPNSAIIPYLDFSRCLFGLSDNIRHLHDQLINNLNILIKEYRFSIATLLSENIILVNQLLGHDTKSFPISEIIWKKLIQTENSVNNIHIVKIVGNLFKSIISRSPEDLISAVTNYLLNGNAFIIVPSLCNIISLVSNDEKLHVTLFQSEHAWSSIIQCLSDPYDSAIRKKCIFLIHFMLDTNNKCISEEEKNMWLEVITVIEILEETQGHIIKPILARIPKIACFVSDKKLSIMWINVIFNRLMYQESKMISRWGMQLLLELGPAIFLQDNNMEVLENLLFTHLGRTFMFYRPNFLPKGSCPPIVNQLKQFVDILFEEMSIEQSQTFVLKILRLIEKPKLGSTPLVMLSYILSGLVLSFCLDKDIIITISNINRKIIPTQPHIVKGCVQGFFLKFIINNISPTLENLKSLQLFINSLWLQFIVDKNHPLWIQVARYVNKCLSLDIDAQIIYFLNQLKVNEEVITAYTNVQGVSVLLAMIESPILAKMDPVPNSLICVLESCGSNLYISENKVITSSQILNIIIEYLSDNEDNYMISSIIESEIILDNLTLFLMRYLERLFMNDRLQKVNIDLQKLDNVKDIAKLMVNIVQFKDGTKQSVFNLISNKIQTIADTHIELPTLLFCASLIKAMNINDLQYNIGQNLILNEIQWLTSRLSSNSLFVLEGTWFCYCFLLLSESISVYDVLELFGFAVDNIQKMKDAAAIKITLELIIKITPQVLDTNTEIFCNSIRGLWVTLQDFLNSSVYWELLAKFCDTIFNPVVMENDKCVYLTKEWLNKLEDLSIEKENVFYHMIESITKYKSSKMEKLPEYIKNFTKLALFGVSQCREKQNTKDLVSFISSFGRKIPVNAVYIMVNKDASLARVKLISFIYSVLLHHENTYMVLDVFNDFMSIFDKFEKSALINSLTNRIRIRVWQAILCLMPLMIENTKCTDNNVLFDKLLSCLKVDTQPSVRCYIECCLCYMMATKAKFLKTILFILNEYNTHSNSFLTSTMSILVHHMQYLHSRSKLSLQELYESLLHVSVWACCNNHNVRNFASACILQLAKLYNDNDWSIPSQFVNQIEYLKESSDYVKFNKKLNEHNNYFSQFNISTDLCLANIFYSLPKHFNILENEYVSLIDIMDIQTEIPYPVLNGHFHTIPKVFSEYEQADYLISFKDITVSREIQKKITPWQVMASNLGIEFQRSVTKKGELVVYASLIDKATNLGGLSRTSEIFGVKTMVVNNLEVLNNKEFKSLSVTSEKWIDFYQVKYDDSKIYFEDMKRNGYTIVGVEQTANSISLEDFEFPKKSLLVLGREKDGIPVEYLDNLDICIEIPQLGLIRSLNVHVSASIMVWEYSKQHLFKNEDKKSGTIGE